MKISNFNENNIISTITKGTESTIYIYNDNGNYVVLKKYNNNYLECFNNENKELKLIILENEEVLKKDLRPLSRMYHMGKFIGFTSEYVTHVPLSSIKHKSNKLNVLKLLRNKYQNLNSHNIFIGDFNENNFGLTQHGIMLYDIDNFKIDNLDFNVTNPIMQDYMRKHKKTEHIDYYCFNYFVLSYLSNIPFYEISKAIITNDLPRYLKTPEVLNFIDYLENITDDTIIEKTPDGNHKTLINIIK